MHTLLFIYLFVYIKQGSSFIDKKFSRTLLISLFSNNAPQHGNFSKPYINSEVIASCYVRSVYCFIIIGLEVF